MPQQDLHLLPKFRDRGTFLYVEHARIDRHENAIAVHDMTGLTPVPVADLAVIMFGPGTTITQAAIVVLAQNNCLALWCGEENVRFYASGMGGSRSAARLLHQVAAAANPETHLEVAKRMYRMRFEDPIPDDVTIESLRGMEGARVRKAYANMSETTGVPWSGRSYDRGNWHAANPVNRALSAANSCLYGLCHAAILSAGYSPAIGFIHTGLQLSFVYDVADLYKTEITIPIAFLLAAKGEENIERAARMACRDLFRSARLVQRIIPDIRAVLGEIPDEEEIAVFDEDPALPHDLWSPNPTSETEQ